MGKIYGYKENDIKGLAEFLSKNKGKTLSTVFAEYGLKIGKAKGTVRNMYYALAKHSLSDQEFCNKYLGGSPLSVSKIIEFGRSEERLLVKKILLGKRDGKSARSIIMEMANGDIKLALRYQNKYRNAIKNNPHLIAEIISEIRSDGRGEVTAPERKLTGVSINEIQFKRLKNEIDNLVNRISLKIRKENEYLKSRVASLELENVRYRNILYGNSKALDAIKFIGKYQDENVLN